MLDAVGKPHVEVSAVPAVALGLAALFWPMLREVRAMSYQFTRPFVLDDTAARALFGIDPTPWDEVCRRTAES